MKKLFLSLIVVFIAVFSFIACNKDSLASSQTQSLIPDIQLDKIEKQFTQAVQIGNSGIVMPLRRWTRVCKSCPQYAFCMCTDIPCRGVDWATFLKIRENEPELSLTSIERINEELISIEVLAPDAETLKKLQTGEAKNIFSIDEDIPLTDRMIETLHLGKGAHFAAGEYPVELNEKSPYGKMSVKISY